MFFRVFDVKRTKDFYFLYIRKNMASLKEDLLEVDAYPEKNSKISFVQTHISMVFIGDEYVYKVKKPVNFGFLDFSTLEKRKIYCEKEVELNRRFSEGIYIGVFPIIEVDGEHKIAATSVAENENVVDYAVKMYKIPNELF